MAARQHACITIRQCRGVGLSPDAVHRLVRIGAWARTGPGVYRVNGAPMDWRSRAMAAVLAAEPDAVVSHRSAAHLWGLVGFDAPGRIEVTVPRHSRPKGRSGVTVHETSAWNLAQPSKRWGIPVAGAARTFIDLGAVLDEPALARALDEIRRKRLATWSELWEALVLHARRGRPGIVRCRQVLDRRYGRAVTHGEFARLFLRMLEDAGLPAPVAEHPVVVDGHTYRLDLAYSADWLAIELDGRGTHDNDPAYESDRVRDNRLRLAGWTVLHYTWRRLMEEPASIVREIRRSFVGSTATPERRNEGPLA